MEAILHTAVEKFSMFWYVEKLKVKGYLSHLPGKFLLAEGTADIGMTLLFLLI